MATQETPLFKIHDATVRRKEKVILHVDDFELAEGENIALLGPNGAGKSTFIQLLTREVLPLHRDVPPVIFRGQERPSLADIKACFGVVSNTMHDQVRVHLPARDIVCGGLFGTLGIPRHVHATEADFKKAEEQLERLGIGELANRDIMTMSTGQVRRVLVARELIHDPQALIFDEPCTGLDPEGMYQLRGVIRGAIGHFGHALPRRHHSRHRSRAPYQGRRHVCRRQKGRASHGRLHDGTLRCALGCRKQPRLVFAS